MNDIIHRSHDINKQMKSVHNSKVLKSNKFGYLSCVDEGQRYWVSAERDGQLFGCQEGTHVDRIRSSIMSALKKQLKELMMDFQGLKKTRMDECKEIGYGQCDEESLSIAIQEHGKGEVWETALEIEERHLAVMEIAKGCSELHQTFLELDVIVQAQGDMIDDIEHHVVNAVQYVMMEPITLGLQRSARSAAGDA